MAGRRVALLVATDAYDDPKLKQLTAPHPDALALADVLSDEMLGQFSTSVLTNATSTAICERLDETLGDCTPADVVLLHFACHGVKDDNRDLYLATRNTNTRLLPSTAVSARLVRQLISRSRAGVVILMLDCCFGGAFSGTGRAVLGEAVDVDEGFVDAELPAGRGRVVITAASATEYAFEGEEITDIGVRRSSVFTRSLTQGLRTGDADLDQDGLIRIDELYRYLYDRVRSIGPKQTPAMWSSNVRGDLYVARSPRRRSQPADLPDPLVALLGHQNPPLIRAGGVNMLVELVRGTDLEMAAAARDMLRRLADDDSQRVSRQASEGLNATRLRLSTEEVDLGVLVPPYDHPPVEVQLLGGPLVALSSVRADPAVRAHVIGDRLLVKAVVSAPGPLTASVAISGPAGDASLPVVGWVATTPAALLAEAEPAARAVPADSDRAILLALLAAVRAWTGERSGFLELLDQADLAIERVYQPEPHAVLPAVVALAGALGGNRDRGRRLVADVATAIRVRAGSSASRAIALGLAALVASWFGDEPQANRLQTEAALTHVPNEGEAQSLVPVLVVQWVALRTGSSLSADLISTLTDMIGRRVTDAFPRALLGATLAWATAPDAGPARVVQALQAGRELGWLSPLPGALGWAIGPAGTPAETAEMFRTAHTTAGAIADPQERSVALSGIALAMVWAGVGAAETAPLWSEARAAADAVADVFEQTLARGLFVLVAYWSGETAQVEPVLDAMTSAAGTIDDPAEKAAALAATSLVAWWGGVPERAAQLLSDAEDATDALENTAVTPHLGLFLDWAAYRTGDGEQARWIVGDMAEVVATVEDSFWRAVLLAALAWATSPSAATWLPPVAPALTWVLGRVTDPSATADLLERARTEAAGVADPVEKVAALAVTALAAAWTGNQLTALDDARQAMADVPDGAARAALALLCDWVGMRGGDERSAARLVDDLADLVRTVEEPDIQAILLSALAWTTAQIAGDGRLAGALTWLLGPAAGAATARLLADAHTQATEVAMPVDRGIALSVVALVRAEAGGRDEALGTLDEVRRLATTDVDRPEDKALLLAAAAWLTHLATAGPGSLLRGLVSHYVELRDAVRPA